ncbi:diaminopropionate ammonia-lyase [Pandoraea nosoerga]|uniref:diaminopropionate ammonia-lyase n=1 Tax=Pandoraea nosoerga TaxID=2508296 RepID=UPI0019825FE8|nr:diaminopropionate ammonia-lyase [Pandoraea nosoerga]MBN4664496.1 diaminopropionate ammonia-lyase [Pandoraea nosoerga]MBN4674468.1 diaminopropionate ammonia-lyase [Pandoraea nosoerga]MBN4679736.1 diaminopropionate ammonia-lyase [Pandoraea nosoerga]MBN4743176.1 diaminopropionate ammonia-lyase [Pandoraea nosoerga]
MLYVNPHVMRAPYPAPLQDIMSIARAQQSRTWLSHWSGLRPGSTPLRVLPELAAELGVSGVLVKDEAQRSSLGSFKALGAPIALARLLLREYGGYDEYGEHGEHGEHGGSGITAATLFQGEHRDALSDFTVISATDGNHGRALAAAAQSIGCRCVIVLHAHVSEEREQAIAAHGARIVRIAGNYDDSVAEAAALAHRHGWHVVSDTSYEGYEAIPRDVMQGYGVIAAEIEEALHADGRACPLTHVFLQGGVGGLAAGVVSYVWERWGAWRPTFVVVEPVQADCLYQSAMAGKPASASGSVDSVMAGLACGETSPLAWRFLQPSVDAFMTVTDAQAVAAMQRLARGSERDAPFVAGESGAAGLAGLMQAAASPEMAQAIGLDAASRVLLINTEGATAPSVYAELVGEPADSVLARGQAWHARRQTHGGSLA